MKNDTIGTLALLSISLLAACVRATFAPIQRQESPTQRNSTSASDDKDIPRDSVPQHQPCRDQTKSFKELSQSFASGRPPSRSEVIGSWVLIGLWLYKESRADLNCEGIRRGKIFEWVMIADSSSFGVDMAGTYLTSTLEADRTGNLTFTIDLQGDYNPVFRCRITQQKTLVCLGEPYYSGSEFKRMRVNCEPLTPAMADLNRVRLCLPPNDR